MNKKDLKIAAIITSVCLVLSFGASYSYARGLYWTSGVLPLVLTVILVLLATVVLESVRGPANVSVSSPLDMAGRNLSPASNTRTVTIGASDLLASPFYVLLWLFFVILGFIHSRLLRARRPHTSGILGTPHGAHS